MFYYINPRTHVMLLQIVAIVFLFIIIAMMFYLSSQTGDISSEINDIDIPPCPACPSCPSCPTCPSQCKELSDKKETMEKESEKTDVQCPECPVCETKNYPTVDEIVSGIFPGRNMGLTRGGKYFSVDESNYELLPEYNYYDSTKAFPEDSILNQMATGGPVINQERLETDNSFENMNINTSMSMGLMGNTRSGNNPGITNSKMPDAILAEEIVEGEVVMDEMGEMDEMDEMGEMGEMGEMDEMGEMGEMGENP